MDEVDEEGLIRSVIRGQSRALLLWVLDRKSASGYELTKELERLTGHKQSVGVVYPLLYEFEERGLITGEWEQRGRRRRIKNYSITDLGSKMLDNIRELLEMPVREVINQIVQKERKSQCKSDIENIAAQGIAYCIIEISFSGVFNGYNGVGY